MADPLDAAKTVPCSPRPAVVLGSVRAVGPRIGVGWATCAPRFITNGGDTASEAVRIRWVGWGAAASSGSGVTWLDTNAGAGLGPVRIMLRAFDLGRCSPHGPQAYRRLEFREPRRVGGPLGPWTLWRGPTTSPLHTICNSY